MQLQSGSHRWIVAAVAAFWISAIALIASCSVVAAESHAAAAKSRGASGGAAAGLSPAERQALAGARRRHGLPVGVRVPRWAQLSRQRPYFTPNPRLLKLLSTSGKPTNDSGWADDEGNLGAGRPSRGASGAEGVHNLLGLRLGAEVPPIRFLGGTVQEKPRVNLVFWGGNWNSSPGAALRTQLIKFYEGLSGSAEQSVLTQYFDGGGYISSTVEITSHTDERVGAPSEVNEEAISAEAGYAHEAWSLSSGTNSQYAIFTAPGSTYQSSFTGGFCAFHGVTTGASSGLVFTFVPYEGDEPFNEREYCTPYYGHGSAADATSVMASHEYSEAATDPIWDTSPGWRNRSTSEGEIGDLCATPGDELSNGSWVQGWYDDHQSACSESDVNPPHVLGLTEATTNVTQQTATLNATVNPEGSATGYYFEYGPTTSYGSRVPATGEVSVGSTQSNIAVSQSIGGLTVEKTYHYRVVVKNGNGTTYGEDRTAIPSYWTIRETPHQSTWQEDWLNDVSCWAPYACMAVGYYHDPTVTPEDNVNLAYQLTGGRWVQRGIVGIEGEEFPELIGVSCTSLTTCTAVGRAYKSGQWKPEIMRWNGAGWNRESVALPVGAVAAELRGVTCPSTSECIAVGSMKESSGLWINYTALWNGSSWTSLSTPTSTGVQQSIVEKVSCANPGPCIAVGWYNPPNGAASEPFSLLRVNGVWQLQSRSHRGYLDGVSCASPEFCEAVGEDYELTGGVTEVWNGKEWLAPSTIGLPDLLGAQLEGVSCVAPSECSAVGAGYSTTGYQYTTLAEKWAGSSWLEQSTPRQSELAPNYMKAVSCVGVSGCVGAGWSDAYEEWATLVEAHLGEFNTPVFRSVFGSYGGGAGQVDYPIGVAVDASGNVWVPDTYDNRVDEFTSAGEFVLAFGKGVNKTKVESGGSEAEKNLCTAASGNVCQAGTAGAGAGQFDLPKNIAFTSSGNLWVTNSGSDRVEEVNNRGEYITQFGSEGTAEGQFVEPWGVAVAANGSVWVTDARYNRVEQFSSSGGFIRAINGSGRTGSGPGEFSYAEGIAIDKEGYLWVVDRDNDRVQVFGSLGGYVGQFGTKGTGNGQFEYPSGIAVTAAGNLLVADTNNHRIQEMAPTGQYIAQYGASGGSGELLFYPEGVAAGPGGAEYVADTNQHELARWSQPASPEAVTQAATGVTSLEATLTATVNASGLPTTYRFEYGKTTAYGTNAPASGESIGSGIAPVQKTRIVKELLPETTYHYRVVVVSQGGTAYGADKTFSTPAVVPEFSFAFYGGGAGEINYPIGVAVDASGNVWVPDTYDNRVDEFTSAGEFVLAFGKGVDKTKVEHGGSEAEKNLCTAASGDVCQAGTAGAGAGQFDLPKNIAFTSSGNLWVTNSGSDRVEEVNNRGEYITQFGSEGTAEGQFVEPWGVAVAADGSVWVTDARYNRVEQFSSSGGFIRAINGSGRTGSGPGEFSYAEGIAIDKEGYLWVVDRDNDRVQVFNSVGGYSGQFGTKGTGNGQFEYPSGIAVTAAGNLLVVDTNNHRIQEISRAGQYMAQYGASNWLSYPEGVAVSPDGSDYIANTNQDEIQKWYWAPAAPEAATQAATGVHSTEATLNGYVNPSGLATTYHFEYGTTVSYGSSAPVPSGSAGSGTATVHESKLVKGLQAYTTYHFRIVAENVLGTVRGPDRTFTTLGVAPVNTVLPQLSTTSPRQGIALSVSNGTWTGTPAPSYAYQWQRCNSSGAECANIVGATSSKYTPVQADVSNTLRASVEATNVAGKASATTLTSGAVVAGAGTQTVDSSGINAVSCVPATTDCVVGDSAGNAYYSTNVNTSGTATWKSWTGPGVSPSEAVACPSTSVCLMAAGSKSGYGGTLYYATSLGGSWTMAYNPSYGVDAISCVSSSFCVDAQNGFGYFRYSTAPASTSWTLEDQGSASMKGVFCLSSSFCAISDGSGSVHVATTTTQIESSSWTSTSVDGTTELNGVACTSSSSCVAVDTAGNVLNLTINPSTGAASATKQDIDGSNDLTAVTCTGSSNCVAVDSVGNVFLSTNAGTSWVKEDALGTDLTAVSCASTSLCAAVDTSGRVITFEA